jgi:hypothetical protein
MTLLRAEVRGIPAANDLESLERVHVGLQVTGTDPAIQGDGEARRIPGRPVLAIVLARGGVNSPPPFPLSHSLFRRPTEETINFAFCVYTIGNVDGRHSGTIKLLEAAG